MFFVQTRKKLTHCLLNFQEKYAKLMHFSQFSTFLQGIIYQEVKHENTGVKSSSQERMKDEGETRGTEGEELKS